MMSSEFGIKSIQLLRHSLREVEGSVIGATLQILETCSEASHRSASDASSLPRVRKSARFNFGHGQQVTQEHEVEGGAVFLQQR